MTKEIESYAWLERLVMRELSFHKFSREREIDRLLLGLVSKILLEKMGDGVIYEAFEGYDHRRRLSLV